MRKLKISKSLTGQRVRSSEANDLVVTPTEGTIRVEAGLAEKLGVDYRKVNTSSKDDAGVRITVVEAEIAGKTTVVAYLDVDGSKLASSNKKMGGNLTFSSVVAWEDLKGRANHQRTYKVVGTCVTFNEEGAPVTVAEAKESGLLDARGRWTEAAAENGDCDEDQVGTAAETIVMFDEGTEEYVKPRKKRAKSEDAGEGTDAGAEGDDEDEDDFDEDEDEDDDFEDDEEGDDEEEDDDDDF